MQAGRHWAAGRMGSPACTPSTLFLCFPRRLHARFYELAPNLVPMDYRKSPIVHVPMSLIIQMPELRVRERPLLWGREGEAAREGWAEGLGTLPLRMGRAAEVPYTLQGCWPVLSRLPLC